MTNNGIVTAEYSYYLDGSIRSLKNDSLYTEYVFDEDNSLTCLKMKLSIEVLAYNRYIYDFNEKRMKKRQFNESALHGQKQLVYDVDQYT